MENIRNIISNLYIYKFQNNDILNINKLGNKSKIEESLSKEDIYEKTNQDISNFPTKNKNNSNNIETINSNNKSKNNPRLDNYNQKYISLKNHNFLKNEVNYVLKNKELLKEKEMQMKELKIKKENDALNLLLSSKNKYNNGVRSKLYDYEIKQKKDKMNLAKKNKIKIRNLLSQQTLRRMNNNININNNNSTKKNENENEYQQIDEYNNSNKNKITFTKSLKLPKIQFKPSTSPILEGVPILHKDYGKMPEYLEKRKIELKEQKEMEIIRQKERNLPSGFKLLSEEERQKRLNILKNEKIKLEEELYKLPIARISEKQKKLKAEIEKSLDEIDEKMYKLIGYKEVVIKE